MAATQVPVTDAAAAPDRLARDEARRLACYVLGVQPSDELTDGFLRAEARVLAAGRPTAGDEAVEAYVARHPWALPLLDAGTAFVGDAPRLRRRLIVMTAVLEATPDHVDRTLPVDGAGLPETLVRLGIAGVTAGVKLALGVPLAWAVTRRAR